MTSTKNTAIVINVAGLIFSLRFFIVYDPVLVINDVFVEELSACLQMDCDEPLVSEIVELHVMPSLPIVHRAAQLNHVVSWTSVVQHEYLWLLSALFLVESADDRVNLQDAVMLIKLGTLSS